MFLAPFQVAMAGHYCRRAGTPRGARGRGSGQRHARAVIRPRFRNIRNSRGSSI